SLCRGHEKLVAFIGWLGFIIGLFVLKLFVTSSPVFNWLFYMSLVYFGLIFILSYFNFHISKLIARMSHLLAAALFSFVIAIAGSTIIYQAKSHHIDIDLKKTIHRYVKRDDPNAANLTRTLLSRLQQEFKTITIPALTDSMAIVQTRFNHIINTTMQNSNEFYSFDLQLINTDDSVLAEYSNNLNTPQWVHHFNLSQLKSVTNIQRVIKGSNRPIVQHPKLVDAEKYQ